MKKRNMLQLVLIIAFSLVFVLFTFLIVQEMLLNQKTTAEINNIRASIAEQQVLLQKMRLDEARADEMAEQLSTIQKMIPAQAGQNQFLLLVQQLSQDASLQLLNVSFGAQVIGEEFVVMPVDISLQGGFKGFLRLLSALMYGERLVRVDDIDLMDDAGKLSITIKASLFYQLSSKS